jgi:hypothetical protein
MTLNERTPRVLCVFGMLLTGFRSSVPQMVEGRAKSSNLPPDSAEGNYPGLMTPSRWLIVAK